MTVNRFAHTCLATASALLCLAAGAQTSASAAAEVSNEAALRAAAQKAVESNPELSARLNALRASSAAADAARGAWLPKVDLDAEVGTARDRISTRTPTEQSLSRSGVALNLTQVLWDARAITSEVRRTGHERTAKWFEWLDATETTAVEAARAHHDVQRFRKLVSLAQESLAQHRLVATQVGSRVGAGVGRGVDLEQSNARLALAETNVVTEAANLHDVTARYVRVVGEAPPQRVGAASAAGPGSGLPASETDAVRAARANNEGRQGRAWQPRVEARLRAGGGRNFDGALDQRREASAEINLNWNLFNGGSDQARVRQSAALLDQAADLRDKACRDARQVAQVAFNEMQRYAEQLRMYERNVQALERARDAYRQQFDIGQRSLLDLLNTENELYTAKRARVNAEHDMLIAQARVLAAAQQLTTRLGLARPAAEEVPAPENWQAGSDAPGRCPVIALDHLSGTRAVAETPSAPARTNR
jgi:outer membrane protein, adhesin transport system